MSAEAIRIKLEFRDLGPTLRSLGARVRPALVRGMRDAGDELIKHVHVQLESTKPHAPVDRGEYRAAWRKTNTPDGCRVANDSPQAIWMEIGRRPGPVSALGFERLKGWVRRKGLYADALGAVTASLRSRRQAKLTARIDRLKRVEGTRQKIRDLKKRHAAKLQKDAIEKAIESVAWAVRKKIEKEGFAPRRVFTRAIVSAKSDMDQAIEAALSRALAEVANEH